MRFLDYIGQQPSILIGDGAWGTNLMLRGLDTGPDCAENWNLTHPEAVAKLAGEFVHAGARLLTTNTFGGNRIRLAAHRLEAHVAAINERGVAIARNAAGTGIPVVAALGPTGHKNIAENEAEIGYAYAEQADALTRAGADALLLETMTAPEEVAVAMRHIRTVSPLDVVCSYAFRRNTRGQFATWSGAPVETAVRAANEAGAALIGINCYPADSTMARLLEAVAGSSPGAAIWLKPNAGAAATDFAKPAYTHPVDQMPLSIETLQRCRVAVVGGCCGTTPEHIAKLSRALARGRPSRGENVHLPKSGVT